MLHLHSDAYARRALASTATTRAQAQAPIADDTAEEDLPNEPLRKVSKLCHAVNSPAAPSYWKNGPNGASLLASSRTRRETAPTLVGIEPPFSAQLITRPSRARSRTLSDLPPARSRGVHDARENPLRPTSA